MEKEAMKFEGYVGRFREKKGKEKVVITLLS